MGQVFDVAIIGGGINGCGCAADAALRGLSVFLCDEDDLASKTSSKSSKLIHGGLRYLEHFDFHLVKNALSERQKLMRLAPHLVHPLPFVLPYQKNMRPLWLLRLGLFLYDHLSSHNQLPHTRLLHRHQDPNYFIGLKASINQGFLFHDCSTDDARLTILNALQAKEHGADIQTNCKLIDAKVIQKQWYLTLKNKNNETFHITAKALINATGPWVTPINQQLNIPLTHTMTLVKGSHMVVPKLYEGDHAYMLQNDDKRIIFAIPYHHYTLVGTTEVDFNGDLEKIDIDDEEINYLSTCIQHYFNHKILAKDILNTWSGVRPLLSARGKSSSALSRDYDYHFTQDPAPAVTLYGGKITTFRQLAAKSVDTLQTIFPHLPCSISDKIPLPGAMIDAMSFEEYRLYAYKKYRWLHESILERYLESYGTRTERFLSPCTQYSDLGICFSTSLYGVEVDYLIEEEWARTSDDILWRRTKLGLNTTDQEKNSLTAYLKAIHQIAID